MVGPYTVTGRIGSGSYSVVYRAQHGTTGQEVAIKSVDRAKLMVHEKLQGNLEREINILKTFRHANIVQLLDVIYTEKHIYLVLESCPGGDLSKFLRRHGTLDENMVRRMGRQLVAGMRFLRQNNLTHRDLKPQNLLLDSDLSEATLKIADFGLACYLQPETMAATLCGSPLYMV